MTFINTYVLNALIVYPACPLSTLSCMKCILFIAAQHSIRRRSQIVAASLDHVFPIDRPGGTHTALARSLPCVSGSLRYVYRASSNAASACVVRVAAHSSSLDCSICAAVAVNAVVAAINSASAASRAHLSSILVFFIALAAYSSYAVYAYVSA